MADTLLYLGYWLLLLLSNFFHTAPLPETQFPLLIAGASAGAGTGAGAGLQATIRGITASITATKITADNTNVFYFFISSSLKY